VALPDSYRAVTDPIVTVNLPVPRRALAIGAHPDDVEYGCGATLAKWAAAGCEIFHVICTDGSKGTWDPQVDTAELISTRQSEQRRAAEALGGTNPEHVVFLGNVDGELESNLAQRAAIAYWIRRFQPEVVFGHDPWRPYRIHPDHRHAGLLACEGIVAARDPKFFPDQDVSPHRPTTLLLWEAAVVHHVEDVTGFTEAKATALLQHASQFETTMRIDDPSNDVEVGSFREQIRVAAQEVAREAGSPAGIETGEAFAAIHNL
jgi:LmbE family N-acetylglucosaminyl deacetylase